MPAVWVFWGPGEDHLIAAVIQVGNHGGPYHGAAPPRTGRGREWGRSGNNSSPREPSSGRKQRPAVYLVRTGFGHHSGHALGEPAKLGR
jgi:hypothetical protein